VKPGELLKFNIGARGSARAAMVGRLGFADLLFQELCSPISRGRSGNRDHRQSRPRLGVHMCGVRSKPRERRVLKMENSATRGGPCCILCPWAAQRDGSVLSKTPN